MTQETVSGGYISSKGDRFWAVYGVYFIKNAYLRLFMIVFPILATKEKIDPVHIGFIFTVFAISALISSKIRNVHILGSFIIFASISAFSYFGQISKTENEFLVISYASMVLFGLGWAILENQSFSQLKIDKILVSQYSGDILGPIFGAFM